MEAGGLDLSAPSPGLTYEEALALTLVMVDGLSYRELALRLHRTDRETLLLLKQALRRIGQLFGPTPDLTSLRPAATGAQEVECR